jgi:hypothetical protein
MIETNARATPMDILRAFIKCLYHEKEITPIKKEPDALFLYHEPAANAATIIVFGG